MAIALKAPDFQDWIKSKGINPASIVILPDSNSISVGLNHQRVTFNLTDNSGWAAVAGPILSAGKVLASGGGDTVHYNDAFSTTFELGKVAHFYGLPDLTRATTDELERTRTFPQVGQTDAYRSPSIRGDQALAEQQRAVAEVYKRHDASAYPAAPGDADLVEGFTRQWQKKVAGEPVALISIPHQTVLGQWLELYRNLFEGPAVQNWMREQKIDPSTVKIVPSTGTLSAKVDGVEKQFVLTDTSGWRQIAGPLLDVAKVIAPAPNQLLSLAFGTGFIGASMKVVAKFYGERNTANADQSKQRIEQLNSQKSFGAPLKETQSIQALETQRAAAETFYTQAPAKLAYTKQASAVTEAMPNLRAEAKQLAEKILREHLSADQLAKLEPLDADKLYLHQFHGGVTESRARSGWEHPNEEPHQSRTLTEAVMSNFSWHDQLPGELDVNGGIYTEGPGQSKNKGYGAHNEFPFSPSVFMKGVKAANFQGIADKKISEFWTSHESEFRSVAKGTFVDKARQQLKAFEAKSKTEQALQPDEQKFTRDDYSLIMEAVSNVPVDENAPVTLEQLQAEAPAKGKLRAHAFDINGYPSNIIRFADLDDNQYNYLNNRRDGRQILYIPGANPAFLRFDSLKKMDEWVVDQAKDPQKREALASHFSSYNRQEGGIFGKYGVDSSLAHLASGDWESWEGKTIDRGDIKIEEDVFTHLKDEAKTRMSSDADIAIKSNGEVRWDTFLNDVSVGAQLLAKLAPLGWPFAAAAVATGLTEVVLGVRKAASGDTEAERKDGTWKVFDGTLNTLFSAGASGVAKDPFELPTEELPPSENTSVNVEESTPQEPRSAPPEKQPAPDAPRIRTPSSSLVKMSDYVVPRGEEYIANVQPDALGVYRLTGSEGERWNFVRYTDETGRSKVFEIENRYKAGDGTSSIVNPSTGRAVMKVHPGRNGEWVRAPADGGIKWPWQRPVSPTPSDDPKVSPTFSSEFLELDGTKMAGAEKLDKVLKASEGNQFELSSTNFEENGVIKRKFNASWKIEDTEFAVAPEEKAHITEHSTSEYSTPFIKDLNRNPYTVTTTENGVLVTTRLDAAADTTDALSQRRLAQFESVIPDADLRARISEVAHQGAIGPGVIDLNGVKLQEGYYFGAKNTQFQIEYDASTGLTKVHVISEGHLSNPDQDLTHVPGYQVTIKRTFTIREGNGLESAYEIDKDAPTTVEVSAS
ncbi:dermonecrotic toxin domain-containing protein [Pseudomonas reactans]|uniref:dermonecrotic toxin domain-containing protein n=1 Tax=Pseudomonas reactans TaxID=117680 RepID=UPI0015A3A0B7|nr:DUF6543 domain-containing protein [Pseudomonas reactans]NWA65672.1 hypothetical protein [Pseudomonas reactans]